MAACSGASSQSWAVIFCSGVVLARPSVVLNESSQEPFWASACRRDEASASHDRATTCANEQLRSRSRRRALCIPRCLPAHPRAHRSQPR
eukprot:6188515-Pleurochrysis_carterae.AAC.1